jgi:hypothetical protein
LYNDNFEYKLTTGPDGIAHFQEIYDANWKLVVGKWSYRQHAVPEFLLNQNLELEIELDEGYEDDFILDLGWKVVSDDTNVSWKIGDFSEYGLPSSNFPSKDIDGDLGQTCYYTNNYDESDVEYRLHGAIKLVSPPMDLSGYESIDLRYNAWAYGGYNSTKEIILQMPDTNLLLERIPENLSGSFNPESNINIDLLNLRRDSIQFVFKLYNDPDSADRAIRLMGALDGFKLSGKKTVRITPPNNNPMVSIYPNPVEDYLYYTFNNNIKNKQFRIFNTTGQCVRKLKSEDSTKTYINVYELKEGLYFLKIDGDPNLYSFIKL